VATKYFARKPINHKGTHYRPGDEITGFTGWWRYWQFLRYGVVNQIDTAGAPTIDSITPGNTILTLAVTIPSDMGDGFDNYEYQLDGGSWVAFAPADIDSPFVITGLTNGTTYAVRVRALNDAGAGTQSNSVNGTPRTTPAAPTSLVPTPGQTDVSIAFTPGSDGGSAITNYQYKIGAGAWTAFDPVDTTSPVVISGLTAETEYTIYLRAINAAGNGATSAGSTFTTTA
jgi:titin